MTVLVGTASWTDKSLIASGRFYPKGITSAEARLRHYATQFDTVEVDSSYYAMPSASNASLWRDRTPEGFVFNVKAFRLLTGHQTPVESFTKDLRASLPATGKKNYYYKDLPQDLLDEMWRRFIEAVRPLREAGKLGAVHFQFAPWVIRNRDGLAHVAECADRMRDHQLAVEFRNKTWFDEANAANTLEFERELGVAHVVVDEPQGFPNSIPTVWDVTSTKLAVLRLHGRNHETWNIKGATAASDRFNYDYTSGELASFVPEILELEKRVDQVQVIFNNNYEDQGPRNAATLRALLGQVSGSPQSTLI